jgi:hypothetical protein
MKRSDNSTEICYLCGKKLIGVIDDDHVPPKQFYGSSIRGNHKLNLLTIPTHKACNHAFKLDEEYFVYSFAPLIQDSYSGNAVLNDVKRRFNDGLFVPLAHKIRKEFDKSPSGLILPKGKILKRFEGKRIYRVVWKITRGLFYHKENRYLPEDTPSRFIDISGPWERPSEYLSLINDVTSFGDYPGVFDYRYVQLPEVDGMYYWALLLWDRIIVQFVFHDPDCSCDKCNIDN